jgi:hypothetical protein
MTPQGGEGIRAPTPVLAGTVIQVDVGPNDSVVEVSAGSSQTTTSHQVQPGKQANIPIPEVVGGTILSITVGRGARARVIFVEVISLSP